MQKTIWGCTKAVQVKLLMRQGEYEEALELADSIVKKFKAQGVATEPFADACFLYAEVLEELGVEDEAEQLRRKGAWLREVAREPNSPKRLEDSKPLSFGNVRFLPQAGKLLPFRTESLLHAE